MQIIKSEIETIESDKEFLDGLIYLGAKEISKELLKNDAMTIKHLTSAEMKKYHCQRITVISYSLSQKEYERAKEIISKMKTNKKNINALINELECIFENNYKTPNN